MAGISASVYPVAAAVPVTELIMGYTKHDKHLINYGWQTIAGLGINYVASFGIKYAVNRPRPYATYTYIENYRFNKDPSFPSGHTSFAFNTATSLVLLCPEWYVAVPAYGWAAAVGYSRMHLGMHYPTDVIAGAITGAGASWLAYKGNKWLQKRKNKTTTGGH